MKSKHIVLLTAMTLFVLGTVFSVQAEEIGSLDEGKFYTSHGPHSHLGTIVLDSGVGTDIGPYEHRDFDIVRTGWPAINGAVYRDSFYTILNRRVLEGESPEETTEARLAQVNVRTGKVKLLGSAISLNLGGLEISHCGEVFATGFSLINALGGFYGDTNLYHVDLRDASLTLVGDTGLETIMDLAFDPEGTLWATVGNILYTLDTETGASTEIVTITGVESEKEIMGIAFTSTGEIFGTSPFVDGFYSIDLGSGVATKIGNHGLAFAHGGDIPMVPNDARCEGDDN